MFVAFSGDKATDRQRLAAMAGVVSGTDDRRSRE
jgi:hypothetical protein